jgi:hypothetical protein
MEKFTATADPYTGVHAFYPNPPKDSGVWAIIKLLLLAPIVFLLRLPFILVFGALFFGGDFVVSFTPISNLRRVLRRLVHAVFGRLLLFSLGFSFSVSYYPLRHRDADKKRPGSSVSSGDLILANHTSYIDLIYFATLYSPQFTSISSSGLTVAPVTLWEAFSEILHDSRTTKPTMPLSKLQKLAQQSNLGPVLVFPEGTTTNGRILIGVQSVVDVVPDHKAVNLISIRYPHTYQTPSFTGGSFLVHLFKIAGQFVNYAEVVHAMPDVIPTGANKDARGFLDDSMAVLSASSKLSQGRCLRDVKAQFWTKYYEK